MIARTLVLAVGLLLTATGVQAATPYTIDQRYGTLGFEIVEAGVFSSSGVFRRFAGTLLLDFAHPENSRIDVSADADSADIPGPGANDMLRSPDYFDVARFPRIHFVSSTIVPQGGDRFHIDGTIDIRGVALPQAFDAVLTDRKKDAAAGEVADFLVTGALHRSQFGMVADVPFISDTVRLTIWVRLTLAADTPPS